MSATRSVGIHCDRCQQWDWGGVNVSLTEARSELRRAGWTREGREDVCPICNGTAETRYIDGSWMPKLDADPR